MILNSFHSPNFKKIQTLNWLPWVGKNYTKQPAGKKLLILGESHYVPLGEDPDDGYSHVDWTRKFVSKEGLKLTSLYIGNVINPLVCNTERAIFNKKCPTDENKQNLWHSVAFYNLIQRLLTSINTADRPTEKDFLIFIRHPSQYFSWTKWAELINQQVFENNNWYSKLLNELK